jgi:dihydroorotate dehydrogenase electron transfer subunit
MEGGEDFGALPGELAAGMDLEHCCMDGRGGKAGTVLDHFFSGDVEEFSSVYACGPAAMLKRLESSLSGAGKPFEVCLEERMACGLGACQGCAVPVRSDPGGYRMVCRDGPAFPANEIDWERMA